MGLFLVFMVIFGALVSIIYWQDKHHAEILDRLTAIEERMEVE